MKKNIFLTGAPSSGKTTVKKREDIEITEVTKENRDRLPSDIINKL